MTLYGFWEYLALAQSAAGATAVAFHRFPKPVLSDEGISCKRAFTYHIPSKGWLIGAVLSFEVELASRVAPLFP